MASYVGSVVIPRKLPARHMSQTIPCFSPLMHFDITQNKTQRKLISVNRFYSSDEYNNYKKMHSPKSNLFHEHMNFQLSPDQTLNCESSPRPGRHTVFIDTQTTCLIKTLRMKVWCCVYSLSMRGPRLLVFFDRFTPVLDLTRKRQGD